MKFLKNKIFIFFFLCVLLIVCLSPFASSKPDGLEWVAEINVFLHLGEKNPTFFKFSPMPDYKISSILNPAISIIASGLIGLFLTIGLSFIFFKSSKKKNH